MDGLWPNVHIYIIGIWIRTDLFWSRWPYIQCSLWMLKKDLIALYLLKKRIKYIHTCTGIILEHGKSWLDNSNLVYMFKVARGLKLMENYLSAFCRYGLILTKLAHICCWDMNNLWLNYCDFDLISKVPRGLRMLKNSLSAYDLLKELIGFDHTCLVILLSYG